MDWFITRWQYLADFYLIPVYAAVALWGIVHFSTPALFLLTYFGAGVFAWTFVEYVLHRFAFHKFFRREHFAHHRFPTKWIGVAPWFTGSFFIVTYLAWTKTFGAGIGGALFIGFCAGYYAYIAIHLLIHHTDNGFVAGLRCRHELHHATGVEKNFGVSTNLWDHIFGTYQRPA